MLTATVCIGNSDDKLTQERWAGFIEDTGRFISARFGVHFSGFSNPQSRWQNACWVFEIREDDVAYLENVLKALCANYYQDSIALTLGKSKLVAKGKN